MPAQLYDPAAIRRLREAAGLTRTQLAVLIERSYEAVAQYERGSTNPSFTVCQRLMEIFGCEYEDLLAPRPQGPPMPPELDGRFPPPPAGVARGR